MDQMLVSKLRSRLQQLLHRGRLCVHLLPVRLPARPLVVCLSACAFTRPPPPPLLIFSPGMIVILWDDAMAFKTPSHTAAFTSAWTLPYLFGVVIYCYEGIGMVLPIEASMKQRGDFKLVLSGGIAAITVLFLTFGTVRAFRRGVSPGRF
jgi:Transmembrane amino acid transporter protein